MVFKFLSLVLCGTALSLNSFAMAQPRKSYNDHKKEILKVTTYQRSAIIPLLLTLNEWGVREFSAYPYLYSLPEGQLIHPSDLLLVNNPRAIVLTLEKEGEIVALATGLPLNSNGLEAYFHKDVAEAAGWDSAKIFYVAYFLTAPEYHNDETIVRMTYSTLKNYAQELGMTHFCYMEDISNLPHPTKIDGKTIEPWGEVIQAGTPTQITMTTSWPTIQPDGSVANTAHVLEFLVKDLAN